ncbi:MAG: hypothetical protein LAT84_13275 [Balneolia bacterium]|nr:hypothetical protein [Balneolia bacterium]
MISVFIKKKARLAALGAVLILLVSCSSTDDAQREFEDEAFRLPNNFTETDASGNIISEDPNDWRVSPLFSGVVEVNQPAYPNPTTGQNVRIELLVLSLNPVNGIYVRTYIENQFARTLTFDERVPVPQGFISLEFDPRLFDPSGSNTISGARGLHRVYIFDNRQNLITYGDVKVE